MAPAVPRPAVALAASALALPLLVLPGPAAGASPVAPAASSGAARAAVDAAALQVPVYKVVAEGLTAAQARTLAARAGIRPALRADGAFTFTDTARFSRVPSKVVGSGRDEHRHPTVARAVDLKALARIEVPPEESATAYALRYLALPDVYGVEPIVGHTTASRSDRKGRVLGSYQLDTTVSFALSLGNLPVVGPGAKAKVAFDAKGVTALTRAVRDLVPAGTVGVISGDEATKRCTALYPRGVQQMLPVLGYYAPALSASKASGRGTVRLVTPTYVCRPVLPGLGDSERGPLTGRLVPAAPELTPSVSASASSDGTTVSAAVSIRGGTAPYRVSWGSSSTRLSAGGTSVRYRFGARAAVRNEVLTVTVRDANGVAAVATLGLARPGTRSTARATGGPGGLGGEFADTAGIEQTVDEWACAQASAQGFGDVLRSKGRTVRFDWRGANAWEKDFKQSAAGGIDSSYADNVDAQWYTGHGNSGGFTFKTAHDDTSIVPSDARWGDKDLEWLQLESCQVLRDTNGTDDYFDRWGGTFAGLHLLNGFHTNASCVDGGTGGRFAGYLFKQNLWFGTLPALTVQQAWARMADDLEPAGTQWRTISAAGPGWASNLDDHFWGEGSTGPDYRGSQLIGWWAVTGVS
ncbi:MAG TPA: DUF6345 domain-containing protein [Kineosporiaceae bacterium]|jgi:hypothetical protein|nr:DUF6345 domain-containing protein [Kineosporiaceae bacterium]